VRWKEGRISRLEVHAEGRLGSWYDYAYSSAGCLASATDALGARDEYDYDQHHRMIAATIKTGVTFQYEYEENTGRCKKTWGPKGLYAIALRFDLGAKTTYVDGEEPRVITWNDLGMATREALPDGSILQESAFDESGRLLAQVNGAGEGEQYWYDERGNRLRVVDASGRVTAFAYDSRDLLVRKTTADGLTTEHAYDERGARVGLRLPTALSYSFSNDARGRCVAIHENGVPVQLFEYDRAHNVLAETDARGGRTTYAYDALGQRLKSTDPLGRSAHLVYDRRGRISSIRYPDGSTVQRAYDALDNVVREVDEVGRVTEMAYSGMGVLSRITDPFGRHWVFKYTSQEQLAEIKNPRGESYAFARDDAGRIVEERTFDGRVLRYAYHASGRVARVELPDGSHRSFSYDRSGRLLRDEASDGSVIALERDQVGRLVGAVLAEGGREIATRFERDAAGRVTAERQGSRVVRFAYDAVGRRAERVMPDGVTTRYAYDAEGDLIGLIQDGKAYLVERDAAGREVRRRDEAGRVSIESRWDAADQLVEQRVTTPGQGVPQVLVQRQWQLDRGGGPSRVDDLHRGSATFGYDRAGRLREVRRGDRREAFEYDDAGSLVAMLDELGGPGEAWEIGAGNRVARAGGIGYGYDACGRRTRRTGAAPADVTAYAWDCRDLLREVRLPDGSRVRMTYDALGRRIAKEVQAPGAASAHTVEFVWDGDVIAADIRPDRGTRTFVHAPGSFVPVLQVERGEVFAYVTDALGTAMELVDQGGQLVWSASYAAWGKLTEAKESAPAGRRQASSPFRWLGHYADEETGLAGTRYRWYDAEVGRWLSPDPLGVEGGLELFGFDGVPTIDVDPFGLSAAHQKKNVGVRHNSRKEAKEAAAHAHGGKPRPTPPKSDKAKRKAYDEQQKYKQPETHPDSAHPESHFHDGNKSTAKERGKPNVHHSW
jgi:RHS repeat-associated protein